MVIFSLGDHEGVNEADLFVVLYFLKMHVIAVPLCTVCRHEGVKRVVEAIVICFCETLSLLKDCWVCGA